MFFTLERGVMCTHWASALLLPLLLEVEDVSADAFLREALRISIEMLRDQPHVAVVGLGGPQALVPQIEVFGEAGQRTIFMVVVKRI